MYIRVETQNQIAATKYNITTYVYYFTNITRQETITNTDILTLSS